MSGLLGSRPTVDLLQDGQDAYQQIEEKLTI